MQPNHHKRALLKRVLLGAVISAWIAGVAGSFYALLSYKQRPGVAATEVPGAAVWPAASALTLDARRPTLVVLAHPMCPCTRATIDELARLMAHLGGRVNATVLLTLPDGAPPEWRESALVAQAGRIPGVDVRW